MVSKCRREKGGGKEGREKSEQPHELRHHIPHDRPVYKVSGDSRIFSLTYILGEYFAEIFSRIKVEIKFRILK